jgi:hypothetical protein
MSAGREQRNVGKESTVGAAHFVAPGLARFCGNRPRRSLPAQTPWRLKCWGRHRAGSAGASPCRDRESLNTQKSGKYLLREAAALPIFRAPFPPSWGWNRPGHSRAKRNDFETQRQLRTASSGSAHWRALPCCFSGWSGPFLGGLSNWLSCLPTFSTPSPTALRFPS